MSNEYQIISIYFQRKEGQQELPKPSIIAIDGPSAAGKSVIGQGLADSLGYLYFDTGAMYRAVTWQALEKGIAMDDFNRLGDLAETTRIDIARPEVEDSRQYSVFIDGEDITWKIRQSDVEANVSFVSAVPAVRAALTRKQREIGLRGKVVMVGRDIGTVVMPDASLKIFLTASAEERARRRYLELVGRGVKAEYQEILEAMRRRDKIDSERATAPLRPADDSVIVDTDNIGVVEVLEKVRQLVAEKDCQGR